MAHLFPNPGLKGGPCPPYPDYQLKGIKVDIQLLESLKTLSVAECIQLVEDLWDSIAITQEEFGLSEAQQIELERSSMPLEQNHSV